MRLRNRRILVTAAGHGIGRACAVRCREEGAEVYATDLDGTSLDSLREMGIVTATVDGTDEAAVHAFFDRNPFFDAAIHCVGYVHEGSILDCDPSDWRLTFRINVDSFYHLLRGVLPAMRSASTGSIVAISSVASSVKGLPNRAAYGASKAAMLGLMKSVAADFVAEGVRCNAVCPGTITSPSLISRVNQLGAKLGDNEKAMAMFVARQPMNRLGTPEEVAALCAYLVSDESAFVTGQTFALDGGITI